MPKQTAIAKVNEQYLKDRNNGYTREYSNTENTARQMLEEYEREQEEQRRKAAEEQYQRQYSQYQSRHNAEIADWIKGMSPSALADDAQQRRLDAAQGIYTNNSDTKHLGSGRSFGAEEAAAPKTASQKKRREDTAYQKYLAQYDGVSNQTLFTNADYMQNSARAAQMQRDQMASELAANPGLIFNQDFTQGMIVATAQADAKAQAASRLSNEYNKVTRLRNRQEERETYGSLNQNADFVKLSQGNAETAERANNSLSPKMIRYYNIYNREKVRNGATTGAPAEAYVTDDEAGKYFYLWEKQGAEAAEAYYNTYVKSRAQERRTSAERGNVQALAASSPVMGAAMSAASIPLQATGIIGMIDLTVQNAERRLGINTDKPINYNTAWQAPSGQASAIRESVANKIQTDVTKNLIESGHSEKNANLWGSAASFLYQTGMSMADSGVQALLVRVGLPQEAMLTLMAGGAGMNAIREAKQRGASDGEALAYGYAAAFAEGIFEHVSLENLMNAKTPATFRQGVVEVLKQALAEGSEEFSTTYANTLTDMLINGGQSEISQKVLGYMADGLSNKEAYKAAAINWLKNAGMDFLGGALSGGAMGGMNVGVNLALNVKNNYQAGLIQEDLRNIGRAQQAELAARQAYQAAQERTTPPLPQQVGQEQQERVTTPPLPQNAQRDAETQQNNDLRTPAEDNTRTVDVTGALREVNPGLLEAVSEDTTIRDAVNAVNAEVQKGTISANAGAEFLDMMWRAGSDDESRQGFLRSIYDTGTGELRPQALNAARRIDTRSAGQTLRLSDNAPAAQQAPLAAVPTNDYVNANRQEVNNGQKQAEASAASEFRLRARENAAGRQALGGSEWTTGVARLLEAARNTRTNRNLQQRADAAARLQDQAEARRLVKQSGQDLGIEDASDAKTVTVLDNDMLGKEWEQMVSYYASKGVKLQAMIGQIETKDLRANGKPVTVRAWVSGDGKNIIVQADHPTLSWQQLLAHEELHRRIKENSAFKKAAQDALLADKSLKPYLSQIIDRYTEAYRAVKPSITDDEVIEELLADYRAGFDMLDPLGTLAGVRKATKAAARDIRALERRGVAQAENNAEEQSRGSASIEIDPDVAKQFSMEGIEERQVQSLLRENEELKKKLKDAKAQIKTSDRTQPREEDVRRMARELLKAYNSKADGNQVNDSLRELAHTVMSNDARWTDIRDQAVRLAGKILEESSVLVGDDAALNREIRNAIRKEKIAYTNKGDIADYGQWRKDNFGKLKIAKDGVPVDSRWEELQDTYGKGYFPDDIKNPADQIVYLSELYDRLQDVYENPYNQNMAEATEFLANDIIDRVISGEMRQAPTTYADRAETRLARETLRGELREQKIKERLEAERERRKEQIAELKEHYKSKEAKGRENRKAREMRAKIEKHAKQMLATLEHPTDKKHIPDTLLKSVKTVLAAIDLGSGYDTTSGQDGKTLRVGRGTEGAEQTKRTKAFLAVRDALLEESKGLVLDPELLGTVEEPGNLTRLITELADVPIANMNTEQLQVVYDALRGIEGAVKSANRMLSQARWAAVSEAADAIRSENGSKIAPLQLAGPAGRVQDLTRLDMLTPEGYFHRLGKSGQAVFKLLRSAQDKFITNMTQATEATRKIVGDTDVGALEKETHTLTMGGQEVTMTTAQIMELYCLMQRDQGLQHITTGGVLIEPVRKGIKQETQVEPLHPSMEELLNAVRLLTPDEVKMADALQKYLSEDLAELGNEATLNVYGYKKFGQEAKYWKIRSNKNEIPQSIEKETQTTSVANRGFTKAINPQANTSIKIGSIFDTYSQSVNDMATYAAWLDVGEDVNRIRNYVFHDGDGQRTGTVKGVLDRVIGKGGAEYLQRLMADITNGAGMDDTGLTSGFVGAYKAAAIGANIRVIAQQPTAILRAAEMIDPKYLAVGLKNPMKAFERAKEYSPIAQWKDWGYFDINTGRKMKDVLFESSSKLEKVRQASMAMAGKADSFAWGQLWGAVEAETKDKTDLKPGTKEFYQACAERFNDIIDHTQVVDGILQRSQIMRSKNAITRMAVSFMSEPTKQYNQFMSAVYDYRHSGDKKQAKQMLARTTFSMLAAGILNVMAQALVDGLRDDDREKKYWEKVLQAFLGYNPDDNTFGEKFKTFAFSNMGEFINPASYLPYAKDIMSIIQGYSVDRMDMDAISDTITAMTRLYKAMNGEGKQSAGYSLVKAMEQGAKLLGLSVYNIDRDLTALFTTIANDADMPVLQYYLNRYRYKPTENLSKDLKGILWDARQKGEETYNVLYNRLIADGYDPEDIKTAMISRTAEEKGLTAAIKAADAAGNANKSYDTGEILEGFRTVNLPEEEAEPLLEWKLSDKQWERYQAMKEAGITFDERLDIMEEYQRINGDDESKSGEKALDFAHYVDGLDLTENQKATVKDQFSFWSQTKAETTQYDKLTGAGLSSEEAYTIASEFKELEPAEGKAQVSDMQRYRTISKDKTLTEKEKLSAIGSLMGTELVTKSGEPTQWARLNTAVNSGMLVDQALDLMQDGLLDDYERWTDSDAKKAGVGWEVYSEYKARTSEMKADKDENGKTISGSKKEKVVSYISGLKISTAQKDALYYDAGYSESGLKDTPWHKGGGSGSGSYAMARTPSLRIPTAPKVEKPSSGLRIRAATPAAQAPRSGLRIKAQ